MSRPIGAVSVLDFGADPSGRNSSAGAFRAAIEAGRRTRRPVWIPAGTFRIGEQLTVDDVTIRGAGPWYSILTGEPVGLYGRAAPNPSRRVVLRDFAIIGNVHERVDNVSRSGVGGALGGGSVISNLWIQHEKVGIWLDGPMTGVRIANVRILDTLADGINLHRGVSNVIVEHNFIRGTGDDGIAEWSEHDVNHHLLFRRNTVVAPSLANGIALYGGREISVSDNLVSDSVTEGGGIHLGARFGSEPFSGSIKIAGNRILRSGCLDPHWQSGIGALWFYALDRPISARIVVRGLTISDSTQQAVQLKGRSITNLTMRDVEIQGAEIALQVESSGQAILARSKASGIRQDDIVLPASGFVLSDGFGRSGRFRSTRISQRRL
jgi:hypothetical protein